MEGLKSIHYNRNIAYMGQQSLLVKGKDALFHNFL